eukprot:XP_014781592.1 PREDICTED: probable D-lactate dehydrogenase, mitochondrial [Octopus bimaculoides]
MPDNAEEKQLINDLADRMAKRALALNGTCTGEHGIGLGKRHLLTQEFDENTIQVMKEMKKALDPNNILNPSKVLLPA